MLLNSVITEKISLFPPTLPAFLVRYLNTVSLMKKYKDGGQWNTHLGTMQDETELYIRLRHSLHGKLWLRMTNWLQYNTATCLCTLAWTKTLKWYTVMIVLLNCRWPHSHGSHSPLVRDRGLKWYCYNQPMNIKFYFILPWWIVTNRKKNKARLALASSNWMPTLVSENVEWQKKALRD